MEPIGSNVTIVERDMYELFIDHKYKQLFEQEHKMTTKNTEVKRPFLNALAHVVHFVSTPIRSVARVWRWVTGRGGVVLIHSKFGTKVIRVRGRNPRVVNGKLVVDKPHNPCLDLVWLDLNEVKAITYRH